MTWYDHLGVSPTCSRQELRIAFDRQKARLEAARQKTQSHALRARVEVEWRAVHAAWDIVGHPVRRRAYDQHLGVATHPVPPPRKSSVPVGWTILFLILLTIAAIGHLAPLPLLIAGGSAILAATLWWVVAPRHRP